jgi:hypothetical protein
MSFYLYTEERRNVPVYLDAFRAGVIETALRIVDEDDAHLGDAALIGDRPVPGVESAVPRAAFEE